MLRLPRHTKPAAELQGLLQDRQPIDKKKTTIRFVAFLVFFALAVTFISLGVRNLGNREEGLQDIEATLDDSVPLYQVGFSFRHWFSGSSAEIRRGAQELSELYAGALKDAHRLLDPVNSYEGWTNLATLNQNLGRTVTVSRELYEVLEDALALTERGEGYSLFAGALYAEWESLRYALEPADFDPVRDPGEAERLTRLTAATAESANFSLELLDPEGCQVRFTVDQRYLELLAELELEEAPILDLNVLHDAYKLQLTAARVEARGYDRGYLLTEDGLLLALSGYGDGGDFQLYSLREDGEVLPAATVPITPGCCIVQLRAFGFPEEAGYYALEQGSELLLRHPNLPADGRYRELLLTALLRSETLSAPETCLAGLSLFAQDSPEALTARAKALPAAAALVLRREPGTVYVTDEALQPVTDYGYRTELIS